MDPADYQKLLDCVFTSDINVCEKVPSGASGSGGAKLINPIGGTAHQVTGADRYIRVRACRVCSCMSTCSYRIIAISLILTCLQVGRILSLIHI